jgi:hypothetical protein
MDNARAGNIFEWICLAASAACITLPAFYSAGKSNGFPVPDKKSVNATNPVLAPIHVNSHIVHVVEPTPRASGSVGTVLFSVAMSLVVGNLNHVFLTPVVPRWASNVIRSLILFIPMLLRVTLFGEPLANELKSLVLSLVPSLFQAYVYPMLQMDSTTSLQNTFNNNLEYKNNLLENQNVLLLNKSKTLGTVNGLLEGKISILQVESKELQQGNLGLVTKNEALEHQIDTLCDRSRLLATENEALQQQTTLSEEKNVSLVSGNEALHIRVSLLEKQNIGLSNENEARQTRLTLFEKQNETFAGKNKALQTRVSLLEKQNKGLIEENEGRQVRLTTLEKQNAGLVDENEARQTSVTILEKQNAGLVDENEARQTRVTILEKQNDGLARESEACQARLALFEQQNNDLAKENKACQTRLALFEKQNVSLTSKTNGLHNRISLLEKQNTGLADENKARQSRVSLLEEENIRLADENKAHQNRVTLLEEENTGLATENEARRNRVSLLEKENIDLTNENKAGQNQVSFLEKENTELAHANKILKEQTHEASKLVAEKGEWFTAEEGSELRTTVKELASLVKYIDSWLGFSKLTTNERKKLQRTRALLAKDSTKVPAGDNEVEKEEGRSSGFVYYLCHALQKAEQRILRLEHLVGVPLPDATLRLQTLLTDRYDVPLPLWALSLGFKLHDKPSPSHTPPTGVLELVSYIVLNHSDPNNTARLRSFCMAVYDGRVNLATLIHQPMLSTAVRMPQAAPVQPAYYSNTAVFGPLPPQANTIPPPTHQPFSPNYPPSQSTFSPSGPSSTPPDTQQSQLSGVTDTLNPVAHEFTPVNPASEAAPTPPESSNTLEASRHAPATSNTEVAPAPPVSSNTLAASRYAPRNPATEAAPTPPESSNTLAASRYAPKNQGDSQSGQHHGGSRGGNRGGNRGRSGRGGSGASR